MGIQQFNRQVDLQIAPLDGGLGLQIKDLRVSFKVERTGTSEPNKIEITVYNLSRNSISAVEKQNQVVTLRAGYKDAMGLIAIGNLRNVTHTKDGDTIRTKMEVRDGGKALYESETYRSYKSGVSRVGVIRDIVNDMSGVSLGLVSAAGLQGNTPNRLALSGYSRTMLDKLANAWGFEWSVQNGIAQFLDSNGTNQITSKVVSEKTGGFPPVKTQRGCEVSFLMDPSIVPGSTITVTSEFLDGYFKVRTAEHSGDTYGSDWFTAVEAIRLG